MKKKWRMQREVGSKQEERMRCARSLPVVLEEARKAVTRSLPTLTSASTYVHQKPVVRSRHSHFRNNRIFLPAVYPQTLPNLVPTVFRISS
jgi:hypothetical protein